MIDLHCHILPGIDDGPKNFDIAIAMAKMAAKDGVQMIVATPHFRNPMDTEEFIGQVLAKIATLNHLLKENRINLKIIPGAEVLLNPFLIDNNKLTDLCINKSRYLLIELPSIYTPTFTGDLIYKLRLMGIIPIIAHPERNNSIIRNPNILFRLVNLGAIMQANAGSITGEYGRRQKFFTHNLIKHNLIHITATDAHSDKNRRPNLKRCFRILKSWVGSKQAEQMCSHLPQAIISNQLITITESKSFRKFR